MFDTTYTVKVSVGCDDVKFEFSNYDEATEFASKALKTAVPVTDYKGVMQYPVVTLTMEPIKLEKNAKEEE